MIARAAVGLPAPLLHPALFAEQECADLLAADLPIRRAEMYSPDVDGAPLVDSRQYSARLSFVTWDWVLHRLQAALTAASEFFGFPALQLREAPRIARYDVGGLFDWHHDAADQPGTPPRRLTGSVPLAPADAYAGGEFAIQHQGAVHVASTLVGAATLFPARWLHRVAPVTEGTRAVLVFWGY